MRLRLTAATSATDSGINKKNLRIGDGNINDFKQRHGNKKIVIMKIAKVDLIRHVIRYIRC